MEYTQRHRRELSELRISDCSSEEENGVIVRSNLKRSGSSGHAPLDITWSSEDELGTENCQSFLNKSLTDRNSITPVSRKWHGSAGKTKLPCLSIKRALSRLNEDRTILGTRNAHLKVASSQHRSPWCKVRKTFSTLRNQISSTTVNASIGHDSNITSINHISPQLSEGTSIEWSSSSSESGSPKKSQDGRAVATQKSSAPTELELLVALIERENVAAKAIRSTAVKKKKKLKRCIRGSYLERLQKLEEANRIEQNFLQHDQHLGLQTGTRMRVLQLNQAYGVHMATVQFEQSDAAAASDCAATTARIILEADMAAHVKVGSIIEAFIDATIKPYTIEKQDGVASKEVIYVQPHKLILL